MHQLYVPCELRAQTSGAPCSLSYAVRMRMENIEFERAFSFVELLDRLCIDKINISRYSGIIIFIYVYIYSYIFLFYSALDISNLV